MNLYAASCFLTAVPSASLYGPARPHLPAGHAAGRHRARQHVFNGSKIKTNGLDLSAVCVQLIGGELTGRHGHSYVMQYQSDDFIDIAGLTLAPGGDFVGYYNITRTASRQSLI